MIRSVAKTTSIIAPGGVVLPDTDGLVCTGTQCAIATRANNCAPHAWFVKEHEAGQLRPLKGPQHSMRRFPRSGLRTPSDKGLMASHSSCDHDFSCHFPVSSQCHILQRCDLPCRTPCMLRGEMGSSSCHVAPHTIYISCLPCFRGFRALCCFYFFSSVLAGVL